MKILFTLFIIFAIFGSVSAAWTAEHTITGDASKLIAEGTKNQM